MGADGDVPRERPLGGRSHLRPVADGSAEDVQVRERRGGPGRAGVPRERGPRGCGAAPPTPAAVLASGSATRGGRGAAEPPSFSLGGVGRVGRRCCLGAWGWNSGKAFV